jgi:basic amino acid/polyamine antiporter, APA family
MMKAKAAQDSIAAADGANRISSARMSPPAKRLGLWSGVGIVVANMVGTGVFLSTGYMSQDLGPGTVLLAWLVGSLVALCGTRAYAALATIVPRSGGEYRFLSDLLHPFLGYLAGWVTLLVGFSAPVAGNALAAAAFTNTLVPGFDTRLLASIYVLVLTLLHAHHSSVSRWTQDGLFAVKAALVLGFVLMGLVGGHNAWPTWTPPNAHDGFPLTPFATGLFFIAFAFSGWNAAIYSAEEFDEPKRTVPRAMAIGCTLVAVFYMLVNWVFVANLTPQRAAVVFEGDSESARVTLGHLIATDVLGSVGGHVMSGLAILSFWSCMSAMIFAGPRVYAAMADDGFLPAALRSRAGRPPSGSIWFQCVITLAIMQAQELRKILANVGAILTLICALTMLGLFRLWLRPGPYQRPSAASVLAAGVYVLVAAATLPFGLSAGTQLAWWLGGLVVISFVAYVITGRLRGRTATAAAPAS